MRKYLVFIVAAAFVIGSVLPAMAADLEISWDGRARLDTYTMDRSKEVTGWANEDDDDLVWTAPGNQRVRMSWTYGSTSGRVDMRDGGFNEFWGQWDFGSGNIRFGEIDGGHPSFNLVDWELWGGWAGTAPGYGSWGADDMIVLTLPLGPVTVMVAAIEPSTATATVATATDLDVDVPALEGSVDFALGPLAFRVWGGISSYTEAVTATNKEYDVDSSIIGIVVNFASGPFVIGGTIWQSENGYQGDNYYVGTYPVGYDAAADVVVDSDNVGWAIGGAYFVNDMFTIAAGYGEEEQERDATSGLAGGRDQGSGWYINLPITVAEGFQIIPEYSVDDFDDQTPSGGVAVQQGDITYFGARWEITF